MRRTRILAIGAAAVAAGLILAGCAGGGGEPQPKSTFDPADLVETTPAGTKAVDHVTWGIHTGEPTSIDPSKAGTDSALLVVANMCETLLLTDPSFGIEPNLATDVEWADPTTLVIDLRDDVCETAHSFGMPGSAGRPVELPAAASRDPRERRLSRRARRLAHRAFRAGPHADPAETRPALSRSRADRAAYGCGTR